MIGRGRRAIFQLGCGAMVAAALSSPAMAGDFRFDRDTLAFTNMTVFEYQEGIPHARRDKEKVARYTRRCFVMSRTVVQFCKFARFDPHAPALGDKELARRIRNVTRRPPWHPDLPADQRVVFPGYRDLRQLSVKRGFILQKNIGLGWPTYLRIGNYRMFFNHSVRYQEKTHQQLNAALERREFFIAYLSDFPTLHINHAVLVYARKNENRDGVDRYDCYDPNHPDGPRELKWLPETKVFNFQKDNEFVGGFTRVYHVYGKAFQ